MVGFDFSDLKEKIIDWLTQQSVVDRITGEEVRDSVLSTLTSVEVLEGWVNELSKGLFKEGFQTTPYRRGTIGAKIDKSGDADFRIVTVDDLQVKNLVTGEYESIVDRVRAVDEALNIALGGGDLRMEITSPDGNIIVDNRFGIGLTAKVLVYFNDLTDKVEKWVWTRQSGDTLEDMNNDALWNSQHKDINSNQIHILGDYVTSSSVKFICDATIDNKHVVGIIQV